MSVDPTFQALLEQIAAQSQNAPKNPTAFLEQGRADSERARTLEVSQHGPIARAEDHMIPGPAGEIPVRLYTPEGNGPFPVLAFFHGGGWCWGNLATHDPLCRWLCHGAGCQVLAVDYRLAPENKFPAGLQDCYSATCWLAAHAEEFNGDPTRIAVGGDSGGGGFAASVALMIRDQGGPELAFQLLLWPAMDFRTTTSSWQDYDGYLMNKEEFGIVKDLYLPDAEAHTQPYAAPSLTPDLHGLPPALIITAECDPLRDGGEEYGQRLQEAGVSATISRYAGMIHGFMHMRDLVPAQTEQALAESCQALRTAFASPENAS